MFSFIKDVFKKAYTQFTQKTAALFQRTHIDEATLKELEQLLIEADTGVKTTKIIIDNLRNKMQSGQLQAGSDLKKALEEELLALIAGTSRAQDGDVYLLVGINGSGKTTFTGKLAHAKAQQGKRVLLVAADTFRAAAVEQLTVWATRSHAQLLTGSQGQDPAAVVFAGCEEYKKGNFDTLIIDTAGRLQTKTNLMRELEKIKKIVARQLPESSVRTLLTIDAMLGQNSLEQARLFHESTQLDGIVLTKMDGTGKGGIVIGIIQDLHIPIAYLSWGEGIDQLAPFNADEYVAGIMQDKT